MNLPNISVIGMGALGKALCRSFLQKGLNLKSVFSRSSGTFSYQLQAYDIQSFPSTLQSTGRLIFLTVPDDSIADTAHRLSALATSFSGYTIVHCSGQKTTSALKLLAEKGAVTGVFHPLQTFTGNEESEAFQEIYFDIEGPPQAIDLLSKVADLLDAHSFEVTPEQKPWLHASAVMASNYVVALLHVAEKIAESGGLPTSQTRKMLLPLVRQSLNNAGGEDLSAALSGPIARGDIETVKDHLLLLQKDTDHGELYKQLGKIAVELAVKKGTCSAEDKEQLDKLLDAK